MSSMTESPSVILIVFVAPGVCICVVILVMLALVFCRKYSVGCCFTLRRTEHSVDDSLHYHSRHSLLGASCNHHSAAMAQAPAGPQLPGGLFIVGKPNHYHLGSTALPRLPSYDSVRKQDRRRQVRAMISRRFGLSGGHEEPPPPSYDETIHPSPDLSPVQLHPVDAHVAAQTQQGTIQCINVDTQNQDQPATGSPGLLSSQRTARSSSFLYI